MIVTLLTLLLLECGTGLFSSRWHIVDGPLIHLVSDGFSRVLTIIQSGTFNVVMALVIVHICTALFYLLRKRENLIVPLITGRVDLPAGPQRKRGLLQAHISQWRCSPSQDSLSGASFRYRVGED